jgi:hypothetical protein
MNKSFSLARFLRLLKAHWVENFYQYLWFVVVSIIVDVIFYIIIFSVSATADHTYKTLQYGGQVGWYTFGLFITGSIFAGLYFRQLTSPGPALISLMRPASTFEKWLLTIVVVSLLFPLAYTIFYSLLQYPAVQLANSLYVAPENCKNCTSDFSFFIPFVTTEAAAGVKESAALMIRVQVFTLVFFWILQSLLLGGTAYFKQSPVLRTVLLMFLLMLILSSFVPEPPVKPFWSASLEVLNLFSTLEKMNAFFFWVGLLGILWAALFYHLKEREVT